MMDLRRPSKDRRANQGRRKKKVRAKVILCSSSERELCIQLGIQTVDIHDGFMRSIPDSDLSVLSNPNPSSSLMYINFTSGSTGIPKGVEIAHDSFTSAVYYQSAALGYADATRVYDFASYVFDTSIEAMFMTLISGACLCVPSDYDRKNGLTSSLRDMKADLVELTPSVARTVDRLRVNSLKTLVLGGEEVYQDDLEGWPSSVRLINTYGPSECTPTSTIQQNCSSREPNNIGRGYGVNTWLIDPQDERNIAPVGAIGELVLEGPLVGLGYFDQLEKTADVFLEQPAWLPLQNKTICTYRLYKTGDLARYCEDGSLVFVSRKDTQVKIRGQRVELAEIEHHLRLQSLKGTGIQAAVEVITPKDSKRPILVAFIALCEYAKRHPAGWADDIAELNAAMAHHLPAYMVPQGYKFVDTLPKSATGKLDRRMLRTLGENHMLEELVGSDIITKSREPNTAMERRMQTLWASILQKSTESICIDDSFMRIGGDSIEAMRLVGAGREKGIQFTVADVFRHPRLKDLASIAREYEENHLGPRVFEPFELVPANSEIPTVEALSTALAVECGIQAQHIVDAFPCTPLQAGLMALTEKKPGDYVAQFVWKFPSTASKDLVRQAWKDVIRACPILRTRIVALCNESLLQVVVDEGVEGRLEESRSTIRAYLQRHRNLSIGLGTPLARFCLIYPQDRHTIGELHLVWTLHHALYDGWSISLLQKFFLLAYRRRERESCRLPPPFQGVIQLITASKTGQMSKFWATYFSGLESDIFPGLPSCNYTPRVNGSIKHEIEELHWPVADISPSTYLRAAWSKCRQSRNW